MSKSILITGVGGFVGQYVAKEAKSQGLYVIGTGMAETLSPKETEYVDQYIACDLTDSKATLALPINSVDCVINLAGLASVGASFSNPDTYLEVNCTIAENICRLIDTLPNKNVRHLYISSGGVYEPKQPLPLTEMSTLSRHCSPYAQSKIASENIVSQFAESGQDTVIVRPFNHSGPGQLGGFLIPDLAAEIIAAKPGSKIPVGNLKTSRDYTHVEDVAKAYILLATLPKSSLHHNLYNVCSGRPVSGEKIFELLQQALRPDENISFIVDDSKIRPDDPLELYGSSKSLFQDTGWQANNDIEKIVRDFASWCLQSSNRVGPS